MDPNQLFDLIVKGGVTALLFLIIWSGAKRIWVWGWVLKEAEDRHDKETAILREERDQWRAVALQGTHLARETVESATALPSLGKQVADDIQKQISTAVAQMLDAHVPPSPGASARRKKP